MGGVTSLKQATIGMRVPAELKRKLVASAEQNDRTLSQEAERRLERSLDPHQLLEDVIAEYGEPEVEIALFFMELLALVRLGRRCGALIGIKKSDLDALRQVIAEIEEAVLA